MNEPQDDSWSPLQEAYVHKVMATYQANLYFFRKQFPDIFDKLMLTDLPAPFEVDAEGKITIYYRHFQGGPREFTDFGRSLYRMFEDPDTRPRIDVNHEFVDDPEQAFPHATNPDFFKPIEPKFRGELIEGFRKIAGEGGHLPRPDFGDHKMPIALVFGSGYGWHLERLVDDWEIRHLILVDTDLTRLNMSLYFVDYISLYQRFAAKGFYFSIAHDEDPKALAEHLRAMLYALWPPYFMQGTGLFFNDYDSDRVKTLWNKLKNDLWTLYRGWGFLDDEILGLKHAMENAIEGYPLYTRKPLNMPADAEVFVVGSGPSLDGLLPVLRANKDRAVIISCGTAITALARAGIKPDLHVEIERTHMTYVVLLDPATREMVKDVPLVALSIMDPAVFTLTDKPLMFQKEIDLGAPLLDIHGKTKRFRSGPTCTNGGVALALDMGFSKIHLVGIDFGFKEAGSHHAKTSLYFDESDKAEALEKIVQDTHITHQKNKSTEGNFCEEVLSTEIFMHSRDAMAITIDEYPGAKVFNLNDGARIRNATPLRPEELRIEADPANKPAALAAMLSSFTDQYDANPFANMGSLMEQLQALRTDLRRILAGELHNKMDIADKLYDMHHYLFDEHHKLTDIFPLVRGSMMHMGRFFYDCALLAKTDEQAVAFAHFGFDLFDRFLAGALDNMLAVVDIGKERLSAKLAGGAQNELVQGEAA
ncbi:motility associated factor glycosyltransferase family protein [Uliginosibacterium sediminicola]|uniref:6-hydroxymethylpterin diphosphokinase MptE-like protein n=1 Tax=Uliginosibacterium sediminicola TaxID=2024550 RepID=A0ABU9YVB8_9RHOO